MQDDETHNVILKAMRGELSSREMATIGLAPDTKKAIQRAIETSPALEEAILNIADLCYRDGACSTLTSEQMISLLITPITEPEPEEAPICDICHRQHSHRDAIANTVIVGQGPDNRTALIPGHEYVITTKTSLQKYPRKWRMGYIGRNDRALMFSARGPNRTHDRQYGGTQTIMSPTIISAREVEADHSKRYVGTPVK